MGVNEIAQVPIDRQMVRDIGGLSCLRLGYQVT